MSSTSVHEVFDLLNSHLIETMNTVWMVFFVLCCSWIWFVSAKHEKHLVLDTSWEEFKKRFNKTYHDSTKDHKRRKAWEWNSKMVAQHNADGAHNYTLALNHFADLTSVQYIRQVVRLRSRKILPSYNEITTLPHHNRTAIPDELDWRKRGFKTDPVNQDDCGSCYAFSIASSIQGQFFKTRGQIVNFSPQQLIDCSVISGNLGCAGGSLRNTLKYIQVVGGLMLEDQYPYIAKQSICGYRRSEAAVKLKTWGILPPKDENSLKVAVAIVGPIAVSINASPNTFQFYASGIYDDQSCSSAYVNHAMLLVGYTRRAWILKNWWSDEWGEGGYMYLARGSNICAIANYAAYATIY